MLFSLTLLEETAAVVSVDGIHPLAESPEHTSSLEFFLVRYCTKEVSVLQDEHYKVNLTEC